MRNVCIEQSVAKNASEGVQNRSVSGPTRTDILQKIFLKMFILSSDEDQRKKNRLRSV